MIRNLDAFIVNCINFHNSVYCLFFYQVNLSSAGPTMKEYETKKKKDSDQKTAKDRKVMAQKSQKTRKLSMLLFYH